MHPSNSTSTQPAPPLRGLPVFGSMFDLTRDRESFLRRGAAQGPVVRFRMANIEIYHVSSPEVPLKARLTLPLNQFIMVINLITIGYIFRFGQE